MYQIPHYIYIHYIRKDLEKVEGISSFLQTSLSLRQRNELNKCNSDTEALTIEVTMKSKRIYRALRRNEKVFKNGYETLIEASKGGNKKLYFVDDINQNKELCKRFFFDISFKTWIFPIVTRTSTLSSTGAISIVYLARNVILSVNVYSSILQIDISWSFGYVYFANEERLV